jgi:serine/threonine-protein kinase HipA
MRKAHIFFQKELAGILEETNSGYKFTYDTHYLTKSKDKMSISLTLPLRELPFESKILFPFFDGLIPEGWLLEMIATDWKINPNDRMNLLLNFCQDCIGAVSVIPFK